MNKKKKKKFLKTKLGSWIVLKLLSFYISFCYLTSRVEYRGKEKLVGVDGCKPIILLFWHARSFALPLFRKRVLKSDSYGLFSDHSDGKLIADLFASKKIDTITASTSSSKGISGLKKAFSVLRKNSILGITPDGPTGPRFRITTDSAFFLSKKTGAVIFPLSITATKIKIFEKSWDKFFALKPFGKIVFHLGDGVVVDRKSSDDEIKKTKNNVEKFMIKKTQDLDMEFLNRKIKPQDYETSRRIVKAKNRKK